MRAKCMIFAFCLLLLSGCGAAEREENSSAISEDFGILYTAEASESIMPAAESEASVTAADISAVLDAEETEIYWLCDFPETPSAVEILSAELLNTEELWNEILSSVFSGAVLTVESASEEGRHLEYEWDGNTLSAAVSDSQIVLETENAADLFYAVLDVLEGQTGLSCNAVREDGKYGFSSNGIFLDTEGYSDMGNGIEWCSGSSVELTSGSRICITSPIRTAVSGTVEEFVSAETVQETFEAFIRAQGLPCVEIVEECKLVYYHANGQLLPAWELLGTEYMSTNGHSRSRLLDAQTGEIIR